MRDEYGFADGSGGVPVNKLFMRLKVNGFDEHLFGGFGADGWTKWLEEEGTGIDLS